MKILTAAQMRDVDRRTIEMGIPGVVLMENAGSRVMEFLYMNDEPYCVISRAGKSNVR